MKKFTSLALAVCALVSTSFASLPTYRTTFSISPCKEDTNAYLAEVQIEKINPNTSSYELIMSPSLLVGKNQTTTLTSTSTQGDEISLDIFVSEEEKVTISVLGKPSQSPE